MTPEELIEERENMVHDFISDINEAAQVLINKLDRMLREAEKTEKELKELKKNL